MKRIITAIAAALSLALVTACSGAPQERQENADQIFGHAKMGLVAATGLVSIYNLMPVCSETSLPPPLCYSEPVGDILNLALSGASDAIESSEKVFAAANSDADARLKAANVAKVVIAELMAKLAKYGVTQIKAD